jgi:adenylosuccinate synthase
MPNLAIVGLQWGDEGKGKIVDYLAGQYDAVVRYNGGSNAGHTVVISGKKHIFHLIPSGALKGKELYIAAGVALDPVVLGEELTLLSDDVKRRLVVDGRCSLVSPVDKELDAFIERLRGPSAIGTTKRGIGPAYALRALRLTPRASDLVQGFDFDPLVKFCEKLSIDTKGLHPWAEGSEALLRGLLGDVGGHVEEIVGSGGSVLFEGSQGSLLDLIHGSYPFVTSTHTTSSYVPAAVGISPAMSGTPLGVTKCYATRVGGGPFPTEIKGTSGELLRSLGNEFGATTGRPRRVGWLDLVALRYTIKLNGVKSIAVSKLDVLSQIKDVKVCTAYRHMGTETRNFQSSLGHLEEVEPVYDSPPPLHGAKFDRGLPAEAKKFIKYLEGALNVRVDLVSHGEDRSSTIEL